MIHYSVVPSLAYRFHEMHLPDGFLSPTIAFLLFLVSFATVFYSAKKVSRYSLETLSKIAVLASVIFAAQMLNFPVVGGTSGHLIGAALATVILGDWALSALTMSVVIITQALLFQDGGLMVLGANIFNMGILPSLITYAVFSSIKIDNKNLKAGLAFIAGLLGVVGGAFTASLELGFSHTTPLNIVLPAMLGVHVLIGTVEGLITAVTYLVYEQKITSYIDTENTPAQSPIWVWAGWALAILITIFAPLASSDPDGLEHVAENLRFSSKALEPAYNIFPDYTIPFIHHEALSVIASGIVGVIVIFVTVRAVQFLLKRRVAENIQDNPEHTR